LIIEAAQIEERNVRPVEMTVAVSANCFFRDAALNNPPITGNPSNIENKSVLNAAAS
jgi:hypothetical protein